MTKEQVLSDIQSLIQDIDKCTGALCRARVNRELESLIMCYEKMEQLIVAAHQELTFLYDYIKDASDFDKLPKWKLTSSLPCWSGEIRVDPIHRLFRYEHYSINADKLFELLPKE